MLAPGKTLNVPFSFGNDMIEVMHTWSNSHDLVSEIGKLGTILIWSNSQFQIKSAISNQAAFIGRSVIGCS